jgi:hypothetical protein
MKWGYDPIDSAPRAADDVSVEFPALSPRRSMSTAQLIIVTALSLAVVALLMVRQRQLD